MKKWYIHHRDWCQTALLFHFSELVAEVKRLNHHHFRVGGQCQSAESDTPKVHDSLCAASREKLSGSHHHFPQAEQKKKKNVNYMHILKLYILLRICTNAITKSWASFSVPTRDVRGCRRMSEATLTTDFTGLILTDEWGWMFNLQARGRGIWEK